MSAQLMNHAGRKDIEGLDKDLSDELVLAGIKVNIASWTQSGEVETHVLGTLNGWVFTRAWRYWICKGPGIPIKEAMELHEKFGQDVRVDGDCGCPSPLERFHGLGTGHYHVDTLIGLKALADTIKSTVEIVKETNDDKIIEYVPWAAWRNDDTGVVFKAPSNWSKDQACKFVERIYNDESFVTVHQL